MSSILVTGGTGSFGRAFIREKLSNWDRVVVFSRDELKQHQFRVELGNPKKVSWQIGDVRDRERLERAFENVDVVIHAAAMKQVTACEYNPWEAVLTNIVGTRNVVEVAIDKGVGKVVFLSSDKAVNPLNLYGSTKLCAEKLFIQQGSIGNRQTRFSCVRYGNVLGSRGSFVTLVKAQRPSGVITVTDANMTRFWMTLNQAVEFVDEVLGKMQGGEVFVPQIPSMSIVDMVKALAPECKVRYIGIRPGEKLHETLIAPDEVRRTVIQIGHVFPYNYVVKPEYVFWAGPEIPGEKMHSPLTSDGNGEWMDAERLLKMVGSWEDRDISGDPLVTWADDQKRFLSG